MKQIIEEIKYKRDLNDYVDSQYPIEAELLEGGVLVTQRKQFWSAEKQKTIDGTQDIFVPYHMIIQIKFTPINPETKPKERTK